MVYRNCESRIVQLRVYVNDANSMLIGKKMRKVCYFLFVIQRDRCKGVVSIELALEVYVY